MLLPQTKEREYRFKLALRMGLPIFALLLALIFHTVIKNSQTLQFSFYVESLVVLVFSIYFILYLIYHGFEVKITDAVSKTFTREYLYKYLTKEIAHHKEYTLILISIDNLEDINRLYGIKNGDRVLEGVAKWVAEYLQSQKIEQFPFGHIKGGDFIIGLPGGSSKYKTLMELMCLKANEFYLDDIEVQFSSSIIDSTYSKDLDYLVERLFELQAENKSSRNESNHETINPNELESYVINAIDKNLLNIMVQAVFKDDDRSFQECFVKLIAPTGKLLYPKNYMKVINKLGLGVKYDLMVLETLIYRTHTEEGTTYAINISPTSLRNEKFLRRLKEYLQESKIKLLFILSESEYYSHTSRYNSILETLHRSGVRVAIDRLGSIHTSFLYLRELSIDFIRFDSYYSTARHLEENRAIVEGFSIMAHKKGVKSWIKNISDSETLSLAKHLDIDYLQGKELADLELIYEAKL